MKTLIAVYSFAANHETVLLIAFAAAVNTMPAELPYLRNIHNWTWAWMRDALKLFLSSRHPGEIAPPAVPPVPQPSEPVHTGEHHEPNEPTL